MMNLSLSRSALLVVLACAGVIGVAFFIQYVLGYAPCSLCLKQRVPYYAGMGLGALAFMLVLAEKPVLARAVLGVIGLAMLAGAGIAVYHAGVEWKFWTGPTECALGTPPALGNLGDMMKDLTRSRIVPCSEPPFRILGISPAGANVPVSLIFALFCLRVAWQRPR